jgi:hypothetical protein
MLLVQSGRGRRGGGGGKPGRRGGGTAAAAAQLQEGARHREYVPGGRGRGWQGEIEKRREK